MKEYRSLREESGVSRKTTDFLGQREMETRALYMKYENWLLFSDGTSVKLKTQNGTLLIFLCLM